MKAQELINALQAVVAEHGDIPVNISCSIPKPREEMSAPIIKQGYVLSEPQFIVVETYDAGSEVSIRDWPY